MWKPSIAMEPIVSERNPYVIFMHQWKHGINEITAILSLPRNQHQHCWNSEHYDENGTEDSHWLIEPGRSLVTKLKPEGFLRMHLQIKAIDDSKREVSKCETYKKSRPHIPVPAIAACICDVQVILAPKEHVKGTFPFREVDWVWIRRDCEARLRRKTFCIWNRQRFSEKTWWREKRAK